MKKFSLNTRKRWILICYAGIIILTVFSIVLMNYYNSKESMESEMEQNQQALLSQMSQNIELRLNYIDSLLSSICERSEIASFFAYGEADETLLNNDIQAITNSDKSVRSVYFMSNISGTVSELGGIYPKENFYDTEWFSDTAQLEKIRVVWTTPRKIINPYSPNMNLEVISMLRTYPLITTPDKIKGYIVINIDTDMLDQIVAESKLE